MPNESHDLVDFMRATSRQMADEYARIRKRTLEDPGTAGDQGEENWATLLRGWLPASYQIVTKGRILSHSGVAGPQVDVLVLSAAYPTHLLDKKLYLAGGVLAAFECKTTLRAQHIEKVVENAVAIRALAPLRYGTPYRELYSPIYYGLLAHSHEWSSDSASVGDKLLQLLSQQDQRHVKHPRELLDLICIADLGVCSVHKSSWQGPKTVNKGEASAEGFYRRAMAPTFGPDGSALTFYVRSVLPAGGTAVDPRFTPIGAALSILLRSLAWEDQALRPIASYFRDTNMEGGGPGYTRRWPREIYSTSIRDDVIDGTHLPTIGKAKPWDGSDIWDEWSSFFG